MVALDFSTRGAFAIGGGAPRSDRDYPLAAIINEEKDTIEENDHDNLIIAPEEEVGMQQ